MIGLNDLLTVREMSEKFKVPKSTIRGRIDRTRYIEGRKWESVVVGNVRRWRLTSEFLRDILHLEDTGVPADALDLSGNPSVEDAMESFSVGIRITVTREQVLRFVSWLHGVAGGHA